MTTTKERKNANATKEQPNHPASNLVFIDFLLHTGILVYSYIYIYPIDDIEGKATKHVAQEESGLCDGGAYLARGEEPLHGQDLVRELGGGPDGPELQSAGGAVKIRQELGIRREDRHEGRGQGPGRPVRGRLQRVRKVPGALA